MMKPPQNEAISKAVAFVMDSISNENGSQLVYRDRAALDSAGLETLTEAENALDVAKSHILKAIDQHITYIHTCRNRAVPIHQLPTEIFTRIVEMDLTSDSYAEVDGCRILELMTVSRVWRDIIITSPQLWTNIQARNPLHVAELFIERSKVLPLSLTWDTGSQPDLDTTNKRFAGLLELVIQNSSRLRSMDVTMDYGSRQTLQRLLGCPTPQLENLRVRTPQYGALEYPPYALSEGGPLKELTLGFVGLLDWDSRRLSGLRVLDLEEPGIAPSINQILHLLSAAPCLETLKLVRLRPSSITPDNRSDEIDNEERPIELPSLKSIQLEGLPPLYCLSILFRIRPGLCNYFLVQDMWRDSTNEMRWEKLLRERGSMMAGLLHLSESSPLDLANDWELSIAFNEGIVGIMDAVPGSKVERTYVGFGFTDPCRVIEGLGEFFCSLDFPLRPISLLMYGDLIWEQRQLDLCSWSSVLGALRVEGIRLVRAAICQLLGQHWTMKDGTVTWACPRLSDVDLRYAWDDCMADNPEMDGMALLLAVQKRWAGDNGIPALPQPSLFRVSCYKMLPSIKSRAETIKSIIPCFELISSTST